MADDTFKTTAGKSIIDKDPDAVLDYTINLTAWLDKVNDSLLTVQVSVNGVVLDASSVVGKTIVMWISGGAVGVTGSATAHFKTAAGREDDRTIFFKIKER